MERRITKQTEPIRSYSTGLWFLGHRTNNGTYINDIAKNRYFKTREEALNYLKKESV